MKLVKVGPTIYQSSAIVATFTLGAWYQFVDRGDRRELVPCPPKQAAKFNALPDATTCPITEGEMAILDEASEIIKESMLYGTKKSLVLEMVSEGVRSGLRKHGPFDPSAETRDLVLCAANKARNLIVYASMHALAKPEEAEQMRKVGVKAAQLLGDIVHSIR